MKTLTIIYLSTVLLAPELLLAQTTEFEGTAILRQRAHVYKVVKRNGCPESYTPVTGSAGTVITNETKYTNGKTETTVEDVIKYPAGGGAITVYTTKELLISLSPNSEGRANLYLDDKDKSRLYVNYWLNAVNKVPENTNIEEWYPDYDCAGVPTMTHRAGADRKLDTTEDFYRMKVDPSTNQGAQDTATTWFKNSEQIRVLAAPGGTVAYYLVDRYDRRAKYILDLQNRESIAYNSHSAKLAAQALPFKYRFGYTRDGKQVKDDVTAGFNIGFFAGYKLTKYSIINKAGTYTNQTHYSLRFGPFLNLSAAALDSVTTTAGKVPMKKDDKQNIAVLSTGFGLMGDLKGFQIGVYGGWDFGMGPDAKNWNYHRRFWLGFGIGFKITDLFEKKD